MLRKWHYLVLLLALVPGAAQAAAPSYFLGTATVKDPISATSGVDVASVSDPSPAKAAGLLPGDRIASINGHVPTSPDDFKASVQASGGTVNLSVVRAGNPVTIPTILLQDTSTVPTVHK